MLQTLLKLSIVGGLITVVLLVSLIHELHHELTHYKRKDLLYKWFAMLINALHWFNPLIYIVVKNINEDCEISCDAAVTKGMNNESKGSYMTTILSLLTYSSTKNQALTTAMASNKNKMEVCNDTNI